jgi:hypothetical protein
MKNGHQSECAYNSKRARYRYGYAVGRKGVANRSIGKGYAWGGKGVVPSFRPVNSTLTFPPLGWARKTGGLGTLTKNQSSYPRDIMAQIEQGCSRSELLTAY